MRARNTHSPNLKKNGIAWMRCFINRNRNRQWMRQKVNKPSIAHTSNKLNASNRIAFGSGDVRISKPINVEISRLLFRKMCVFKQSSPEQKEQRTHTEIENVSVVSCFYRWECTQEERERESAHSKRAQRVQVWVCVWRSLTGAKNHFQYIG